jgi:hypothetical protein
MDLGIIAAVVMLIGWAIATFFFEAPGWVHLFLTLGVTMLIWRIVQRDTPDAVTPAEPARKKKD